MKEETTSVAISLADMDLVKEIADHEFLSKTAVVHLAISRYYGIWVAE